MDEGRSFVELRDALARADEAVAAAKNMKALEAIALLETAAAELQALWEMKRAWHNGPSKHADRA